jgi:hypothetical protein
MVIMCDFLLHNLIIGIISKLQEIAYNRRTGESARDAFHVPEMR